MRRITFISPLLFMVLLAGSVFAQSPNITGITLPSGQSGVEPGQQISITGSGFGSSPGEVVIGGGVEYGPDIVYWDDGLVTVAVDAWAQTGSLYVQTAGNLVSGPESITVIEPNITGITPTSAEPGQQVTITGSGFGTSPARVFIGDIVAYAWEIVSWTDTQVVVVVLAPTNGAQTAPLSVQTAANAMSNSVTLTLLYPNITSIVPTPYADDNVSAVAGFGQITIYGSNFGSTTNGQVEFGNVWYYWPTSWTDNQIVVSVPGNAQSGPVVVQTAAAAQSSPVQLPIAYPTITGISAQPGADDGSGAAVAGFGQVTVTGNNFENTNAYLVFSNSVWWVYNTSWSDQSIVTPVPYNAQSGPVSVWYGAMSNSANPVNLAVEYPTITSISPSTAAPSQTVTLRGTNLGSINGDVVFSNNVWWPYNTSWSDNTVVTSVPSGAQSGPVAVNYGVLSNANNPVNLTVFNGLATTITLTGPGSPSNYGAAVTFNATVSGANATGNVTFYSGNTLLGTQIVSNGTASLTTTNLPAGADAITAIYNGDGTYDGSISAPVVQTVKPLDIYSNDYQNRETIVLSHTKVANTDQSNFPVLISGVYSNLATVANGGFVQNANGYDIVFASDPEGTNPLAFEQSSYNAVTGAVSYWVKLPTLSHTTDTEIYMFYGNAAITTDQSTKIAVWDSNYAAVWHLNEGTGSTSNDSTVNANTGSWSGFGPYYGAGQELPYAGSLDGSTDRVIVPNSASLDINSSTSSVTLEAWIYLTARTTAYIVRKGYEAVNGSEWGLGVYATGGNEYVFFRTVATMGRSQYASSAPLAPGTWYHVAATCVYGAANPTIYVNGVSQTLGLSDGSEGSYRFPATSNPVNLGASSNAADYFPGSIGDVRVSSTVRSSDWIATEYATEGSPATFYSPEPPVTPDSPPTIQMMSPTSGSIGAVVTLQGGGFGSTQGGSAFTFNGLAATPATWNDATIVVPVPEGATSGSVVVTVGNVASNAESFTVPPPVITGISPGAGYEGTQVTITGTGFGAYQGNSTVTVNGATAQAFEWGDTNIIAGVPAVSGTGNVVVTVTHVASDGMSFTVLPSTGTTVLSDSMNRTTTYNYQTVGSRNFVNSVAGSGCASCGGRGNTLLTYDALGNVQTSTDALNNTTTFTYDSMGNVLTKTQYLAANNSLTWTYTYNSFQEVLTATDPLNNVTTNVYDGQGNLLSTTTPPPSGAGPGLTTSFQYDTKGELTKVTDPKGNSTTLAYTAAGLVASITDAQSNATTFTYDGRGNRLTSTDALSNQTSYNYDVMNRLTKVIAPDQTYTQFAYDYRGRRTSVTDANGKVTSYQYDDADRLVAVTDAATNVTAYSYDTENNLVAITDAALHETQFGYDALGRVTSVTFPSTLSEGYSYDAMNNLKSKTDRKNQTIDYAYDNLYRLTSKSYPDSTAVNYTYDLLSRLTQVSDASGTYTFGYDHVGRLVGTGTQYSFLSGALNNSYAYDAASNRVSFTNPQSQVTNYSYDSLNRLTSLTDPNTGYFGFGYDDLGRRTSLDRPNGVDTSYTYDNLSQLSSIQHGNPPLPGSTSYTYDYAGNRTSKTALQQADPHPVQVSSTYSYDNIYELTQAVVNGTTAESYSYDAVGNRQTSAGPTSYSYNSSNELTSDSNASFTYDNNGNTTSKTDTTGTTSYTWDFENRLTQVTLPGEGGTVYLNYDPFGRRIRKTSPSATTIYAYDGDNITEELGAGGNTLAHYTQGGGIDEPLAMYTGTASYYHADGLGSVTSLTDSSGQLAASYVYDSFGKLTASTGALANPFQYTGREFDSETGISYYRARYYDTSTGRFLSEDPLTFGGGINFYSYVHNAPGNLVDPYGLQDSASPWQVGWEWLSGTGPRTHHFTDGDPFTELLRQHQHIQDLINEVCTGTLPPQGRYDYGLGGMQGVPKYLRDYSTLFTGGLTGNLAVTYLGSYGLSYSATNSVLNIHVWNYSNIASATHPPVLGYTTWWNQHIGNPLDNYFSSGPMSQTFQSFDFHENLKADCGCGR